MAEYASGYLLFLRDQTLMARRSISDISKSLETQLLLLNAWQSTMLQTAPCSRHRTAALCSTRQER